VTVVETSRHNYKSGYAPDVGFEVESMLIASDSDLSWALYKAMTIVGSATVFVIGLAWVAARKIFSK